MKNSINNLSTTRKMEIEQAVTGFNTQSFFDECKSDYTQIECIHYVENRMNGFSKSDSHRFIIEDREYDNVK